MDYNIFIDEWIKRAEREEGRDTIDIGDKFISLWIAFNAWLKSRFGEKINDGELIKKVINFQPLVDIFNEIKHDQKFKYLFLDLGQYEILNMQDPENESKKKSYDGSFNSLISSIYAIRCNLFHGRKNFQEDENDKKLVCLAYKILLPLFKNVIQKNG